MFVDYGSYVKHRILASYSSVVMPRSQGPCPLSISPQHLVWVEASHHHPFGSIPVPPNLETMLQSRQRAEVDEVRACVHEAADWCGAFAASAEASWRPIG
jgi:hypothetical protein